MMRGSKNFDSLEEYRQFVQRVATNQNAKRYKAIQEEKTHLKKLPNHRTRDFDLETVRVNSSSIILVRQARYAVPSNLVGSLLKVHVYDDRLECFLGSTSVVSLKRLRWNRGPRPRYINYRFIIPSLARKPQAFRNFVYRDDLFPSYAFKRTWEILDEQLDERTACKEMVKILKITADSEREEEISKYLEGLLLQHQTPRLEDIEKRFGLVHEKVVEIIIKSKEPSDYDALLNVCEISAIG